MSKEINIAVIQSKWHYTLTNKLKEDCVEVLNNHYLRKTISLNIFHYEVPGSAELPVIAAIIAKKKIIDAIICLGVLIKGESDHYSFISRQVAYGIQKVAIENSIPVISGVLTCQSLNLAKARVNGEHSESGKDFAAAAIDIINVSTLVKQR